MLGKIANFVVNSRLRFARNIILVENNRFRTSQLMRSAGTLWVTLKLHRTQKKHKKIKYMKDKLNIFSIISIIIYIVIKNSSFVKSLLVKMTGNNKILFFLFMLFLLLAFILSLISLITNYRTKQIKYISICLILFTFYLFSFWL